jgi:ribosomal protein S1
MQDILNIAVSLKTEGFTGEVESLERDDLPTLYAAMQNKMMLQAHPVGVEKFPVKIKTRENGTFTHVQHDIPSFVFHFNGDVKGVIPAPHSGLLDVEDGVDPTDAFLALSAEEKNEMIGRMRSYLGKLLAFKVVAIHDTVAMLSRSDALRTMAEKTWTELEEGQVRLATVRKLFSWGALCDIGGVTGVIPASEVTHGYVPPSAVLKESKTYNAKIISIDKEHGRIVLSTKALLKNPWGSVPLKYKKGNVYLATVSGMLLSRKGFYVTLEPGVTAITAHPAKFAPEEGAKVHVFIQSVDPEKKKIFASMRKQA